MSYLLCTVGVLPFRQESLSSLPHLLGSSILTAILTVQSCLLWGGDSSWFQRPSHFGVSDEAGRCGGIKLLIP